MNNLQKRDWRPWLLAAGLALSLVVAGVFAWLGLQHVPRRQVDEPLHGWMTVGYIAHSRRVPASVLYAALGLPARPPDHRPIMMIARAQGRPLAAVIADLEKAIAQARAPAAQPSPTSGPGDLSPPAPLSLRWAPGSSTLREGGRKPVPTGGPSTP